MIADERIIALVKPELMALIPSFIKCHAIEKSCQLIERKFPDIYRVFSLTDEPDEASREQMAVIVNEIFEERMNKHHLLNKR